jgi:hypothetical protein
MNTVAAPSITVIPELPGTPTALGIYLGKIRLTEALYAIFQPPKAIAAQPAAEWAPDYKRLDAALSLGDGYANTVAMAKAGSRAAQYALDHGMHIPSIDEMDLQYRLLKPTNNKNYCYMRSGINMSAEPHLHPYTPEFPAQTTLNDFKAGGPEAFEPIGHWSSTQSRDWDDNAWAQDVDVGDQVNYRKSDEFPVRLVRRVVIS